MMELWLGAFFVVIMVIGVIFGLSLLLYYSVKVLFLAAGYIYKEARDNYEKKETK